TLAHAPHSLTHRDDADERPEADEGIEELEPRQPRRVVAARAEEVVLDHRRPRREREKDPGEAAEADERTIAHARPRPAARIPLTTRGTSPRRSKRPGRGSPKRAHP